MCKEELIEVLRQFDDKRVEELPEKARNIFYAIMKIADERDRLNNIINELEKELREGSFDVYFCSTNAQKTFKSNEIIIKSLILDKLKELKENNNE